MAPQWSGALIYCLVEGAAGTVINQRLGHSDVLGPLDCKLSRIDALQIAEELANIANDPTADLPPNRLYTRAVAINTPGKYLVEIRRRGERKLLATATITGVKDRFHAWATFARSARRAELRQAGKVFTTRVEMRPKGIALPSHGGMNPIISFGKERRTCSSCICRTVGSSSVMAPRC